MGKFEITYTFETEFDYKDVEEFAANIRDDVREHHIFKGKNGAVEEETFNLEGVQQLVSNPNRPKDE